MGERCTYMHAYIHTHWNLVLFLPGTPHASWLHALWVRVLGLQMNTRTWKPAQERHPKFVTRQVRDNNWRYRGPCKHWPYTVCVRVCVCLLPHEKTRAHVGMEGQMQTADEIKRRKAQSFYFGTRGKDLNDESKYTAIFLHAMFPQPGSVCCLKILRPSAFLREHVYTCTYNMVPLQILEFAISSPFTRSRASHIFNLVLEGPLFPTFTARFYYFYILYCCFALSAGLSLLHFCKLQTVVG